MAQNFPRHSIKCNDKNYEFCLFKDGVCVRCDNGRTAIVPCNNPSFNKCNFKRSKSYPDGVCINCARISKSIKTVIDELESNIKLYSDNVELFVDLANIIRENNVQLTMPEIRDLCTFWYKQNRPTSKRLHESNELFTMLDRSNQIIGIGFEQVIKTEYVDVDDEEYD